MNGNTSCIYGSEDLILFKCPYCPKQSTDLMQSISKSQWQFFKKYKKSNPEIHMETQMTLVAKAILRMKNKAGASFFQMLKYIIKQ